MSNKPKKRSSTEILESLKEPNKEHAFASYLGKDMVDITATSEKGWVNPDFKKLSRFRRNYSLLHTHPMKEEDLYKFDLTGGGQFNAGGSIPSGGDFFGFLTHKKIRTMRIAQQDPETGKVAGYYFWQKTGKTPIIQRRVKGQQYNQLVEDIYQYEKARYYEEQTDEKGELVNRKEPIPEINDKELRVLATKYNLKLRYVPTKGHYFERGLGFKKSLERKVVASVLGIIFLASSFFFSTNLTGLVILNLNQTTINMVGVILFLLGLVGAFFYFRNRK